MTGIKKLLHVFLIIVVSLLLRPARSSDGHECTRTCEWPPRPMICRYEFTVEWYHTMSRACRNCPFNQTDCYRPLCIPVNGFSRAITVVNRQFPGPSIQVCEFDTIEVKVYNNLINGQGLSIHWHGVHQRGTPHMDGAQLVTQCSIPYRSSFTYRFKADTVGTHMWHAHGAQIGNGALGSLVVRQSASRDVHSALYDHDLPEHVLFLHDWTNLEFNERYSRIIFYETRADPDSLLINGRGRHGLFTSEVGNATINYTTPGHVVRVRQGQRYRFRVVANNVMDCVYELSIDGHNLTAIASDGAPFRPVQASAIGLSGGERYDFVLDANGEVGKYWMRVKGRDSCSGQQVDALLVYDGAEGRPDPPDEEPQAQPGVLLNPYNKKSSPSLINVDELHATGDNWTSVAEADAVHYIEIGFERKPNNYFHHPIHDPAFEVEGDLSTFTGVVTPQMNHVTFRFPTVPILTQYREISEFEMCNFESMMSNREHCTKEFCECTHVLNVELGKVVELVLIDKGGRFTSSHPMHLHGYRFQVLAHDKLGGKFATLDQVKRLDKAGNITRRTENAPLKDTVEVPSAGYVVVRFKADNPGWWLFHCHTQFHFLAGMGMVIHVGTDDDLPPLPSTFPRCGGNWHPDDSPPVSRPPPPCNGKEPIRYSATTVVMLLSLALSYGGIFNLPAFYF